MSVATMLVNFIASVAEFPIAGSFHSRSWRNMVSRPVMTKGTRMEKEGGLGFHHDVATVLIPPITHRH
jgi:hypothetical protein